MQITNTTVCMYIYTYVHPLGVGNLSRVEGYVGGEGTEETGKVDVVCAPAIAVHVPETEHGYEL